MKFATKAQARNYCVKVLGHTNHYLTGSCGDGAYGTREYFKAPDAPKNEYGSPLNHHSTISKIGKSWAVSDFTHTEEIKTVATTSATKYDYPEGLTAKQKQAFRAKARRAKA